MAVVINEFEVMPQSAAKENQTEGKKADEKGASKQPPTDYEVKKMLERRSERLERISAH